MFTDQTLIQLEIEGKHPKGSAVCFTRSTSTHECKLLSEMPGMSAELWVTYPALSVIR
jgi:hypothetical protein